MYLAVDEKKAEQMTCPMSLSSDDGFMPCLGSKCMAWRAITIRPDVGYCGMAGRIEDLLEVEEPEET